MMMMMMTMMTMMMKIASILRITSCFLLCFCGIVHSLRIVEHPVDTFVERNEPATLNCRVEGSTDPSPTIAWYRNGERIESSSYRILRSTGQLFFLKVNYLHSFHNNNNKNHSPSKNKISKALDTGVYYCNATDMKTGLSVVSRNATLQLKESLDDETVETAPLSTETPLGKPVALQCKLQHTDNLGGNQNGKGVVTWMKDGAVVESRERVKVENDGTLYIREVTKDDAGFYTCLVFSNPGGPRESKPVRLMVLEQPQIKEGPTDVVTGVGEEAIFYCKSTGDPEPITAWKKRGGIVPQNRSKILEGHSLKISRVHVEDQGVYVCVVENAVGRDEREARLFVHVPPSFVITPKSKSVNVGRRVSLECEATGHPTPEIFWTREKHELLAFSGQKYGRISVTKFGTMMMERVQKEDAGIYICHAESAAGSTVTKTRLDVKEVNPTNVRPPPIILMGFQNETLPISATAKLPCNATGEPLPTISWFKNARLLPLKDSRFKLLESGTLQISELEESDTGWYTCKASSETGEASWSGALAIESPNNPSIIFKRTPETFTFPKPPVKLQLSEVKETSVRLSWKANPDPGYSKVVSFIVEYFNHDIGDGWTIASDSVKNMTYVIRNLLSGTLYMFLVRAQNSHGISYPSSVTHVKTRGSSSDQNYQAPMDATQYTSSPPDRSPPPSQVQVQLHQPHSFDIGPTSIRVRWDVKYLANTHQSSRHIDGFHVRYCVLPDVKSDRRHGPGLEPSQFATQTVHDAHARSLLIHGLEENTRYMFYIQPYFNSTDRPASNNIYVKTREDVPSAPPTNIQATVLENNTLRLTWMPPPKPHQNGPLVGYKVYVSANGSHSPRDVWMNSTAEVAYIHNLNTAKTYQIQIAAYSSAGEGLISDPILLGFRDLSSLKIQISSDTSRDTSWWVVLICVMAGVVTAFIFISLLVMLRKQKNKEKEKETQFFTNREIGASSLVQSTNGEKETNKPVTPVLENTYENLSSVYSAHSTRGSTIESKLSPAPNGSARLGKANIIAAQQATLRYDQQRHPQLPPPLPMFGSNSEKLICQTYMIKSKPFLDQTNKTDYESAFEAVKQNNHQIHHQLTEPFPPSYEESSASQLMMMRKMSLNSYKDPMLNYFKPIEIRQHPQQQDRLPNNRFFYTVSNRASTHMNSRRPNSSDVEDADVVMKGEMEKRYRSGGRDLFGIPGSSS